MRRSSLVRIAAWLVASLLVVPRASVAQQLDIEEAPIAYSATTDDNRVSDLIQAMKTGQTKLDYDSEFGYLQSILKQLHIPVSSQVLVFSKTSMQISYISPRTPRAVYFNDDTYVAWVRGSSLMEVSTNDPKLGAAFYTVRMSARRPYIKRELYDCLACHTSTMTQGVPGHTVRSVMPNPDGTIDAQRPSFVTDHTSPLAERWGGWYVTGQLGDAQHMGNAVLRGGQLIASGAANRLKLEHEFHTDDWLSSHSDIVALMVLEHQTQMQNTLTKANFEIRKALFDHQTAFAGSDSSAASRTLQDAKQELMFAIQQAAKRVVDYMLFVRESPLTSEVKASTDFAVEFVARGPRDSANRSLRDFNLQTRLFQFPCSYLIYSKAFDSLEFDLKNAVYQHLWSVLAKQNDAPEYAHLSREMRKDILGILRETKSGLPSYWTGPDNDQIAEDALQAISPATASSVPTPRPPADATDTK